jgi:murein DD-endopeptidase MepM/ murein hydrolase activator NlpD
MRPIVGGRKTQGLHGHNGIDLGAYYGAPILASAEGDVIISATSGYNGGYGRYIVISHTNGTQTLYGHLSANIVSAGDHVTQGQVIGAMGSSGKSTGTHLHFEVRGAKNPF